LGEADVGAIATPSIFFIRNLPLPMKWLARIDLHGRDQAKEAEEEKTNENT
jgi:hypothetical protein